MSSGFNRAVMSINLKVTSEARFRGKFHIDRPARLRDRLAVRVPLRVPVRPPAPVLLPPLRDLVCDEPAPRPPALRAPRAVVVPVFPERVLVRLDEPELEPDREPERVLPACRLRAVAPPRPPVVAEPPLRDPPPLRLDRLMPTALPLRPLIERLPVD
jgi:hypothetical protein